MIVRIYGADKASDDDRKELAESITALICGVRKMRIKPYEVTVLFPALLGGSTSSSLVAFVNTQWKFGRGRAVRREITDLITASIWKFGREKPPEKTFAETFSRWKFLGFIQ
ncbi:MAG: hypothetical protein M1355_00315 [Patescibacteria group bacterium]|nr:hypothetical protein [Patescibacteria group bacterium]